MAITNVITITIDETKANTDRDLMAETGLNELAGLKLKDYVKKITSGMAPAKVRTENNAVFASGTFELDTVVATDAIAIAGYTFTAVNSNDDETEFLVGQNDGETAENLAAKINARTQLRGIVTAEASGTTVTVTAARPGLIGNGITISSADATIVASGTHLEGGDDGETDRTHYYGSAS